MLPNKYNSGVTLIELLIVLAITGILTTILVPNLLNARNRSLDVAAQSYLRDAVTTQAIYWFDNSSYTQSVSDLSALGLKP